MKDLFIGIDLGTSSMKLILIDREQHVLSSVSKAYEVVGSREGWREIQPEIWYDSMVQGVRELLSGQDPSRLNRIGITGQMHTLVVVDREGEPIRPALMWNDLRTRDLVPELREKLKGFEGSAYLSRTISTGSPLSNLYWLKQNEPENYRRIGKFLIAPDYLVYRLTGQYVTDYCDASTSCLYDLDQKRWSSQVFDLLGLDFSVCPKVQGSAIPAGSVTEEAAAALCIPAGVPVLTATGDNAAAAMSLGCMAQRQPFISLGTSGVLVVPVGEDWSAPYGKRILFSQDDRNFSQLVQGTVQSNGPTINWWSSGILEKESFDWIDREIDPEAQKDNPVIFYPHMAGEKTIYADSSLRGAFIGLGTESGRAEMSYAMLEGICFGLRMLAEKIGVLLTPEQSFRVVGGGANSKVWLQTLANVLGVTVERVDGNIGASYGIAHQASCKGSDDESIDVPLVVSAVYKPDPVMVAICDQKYAKYKRIYKALKYINGDDTAIYVF